MFPESIAWLWRGGGWIPARAGLVSGTPAAQEELSAAAIAVVASSRRARAAQATRSQETWARRRLTQPPTAPQSVSQRSQQPRPPNKVLASPFPSPAPTRLASSSWCRRQAFNWIHCFVVASLSCWPETGKEKDEQPIRRRSSSKKEDFSLLPSGIQVPIGFFPLPTRSDVSSSQRQPRKFLCRPMAESRRWDVASEVAECLPG